MKAEEVRQKVLKKKEKALPTTAITKRSVFHVGAPKGKWQEKCQSGLSQSLYVVLIVHYGVPGVYHKTLVSEL